MINQKTISEIGSSLGISVTEAHTFDKKDLSKYKMLFKKYKLKKVIEAKSFDDPHWVIVDFIGNRRNLYYDLYKHPNLNNALKCFILINISSDFTISHIASLQSKLRNVIIVTKGFKKDQAEELEEYVQQSGYTNRLKTFVYTNNFLQFIEHQNRNEFDIKAPLQEIYNKNRELPNYEVIVDFHYFMKEFEKSGTSYEKEKFYPVILWWKITGLIPMRPKDFCLLKYDCIFKKTVNISLKYLEQK